MSEGSAVKKAFVLNGTNLNMLGVREPKIYGRQTLDDVRKLCERTGKSLGLEVDFRQTNHEGELIDWVHEAHKASLGIVMNPGALARTSLALHDAVKAVSVPVIEIHISNFYTREAYRPSSYLSKAAIGIICGFGINVYPLGLQALQGLLAGKGSKRRK
jgi:3-dehydroquinate dehydratase-2